MDGLMYVESKHEDAVRIALALRRGDVFLNWTDGSTAFSIGMYPFKSVPFGHRFVSSGIIPPIGMVMVGVEQKGFFRFDLFRKHPDGFHKDYVAEKLNLTGSDAEGIAHLLTLISDLSEEDWVQ